MAGGTSSVVDTSNPNTLTGGGAVIGHSNGAGASAVEPSSVLVAFLYYLVHSGANLQPWAYAAMAFGFQSSNPSNSNGDLSASVSAAGVGVQGHSQPFVYQDAAASGPASSLARTNPLGTATANPQFDSWGTLLSPALAAGQALVGATSSAAGSNNSLLTATSLAQHQT